MIGALAIILRGGRILLIKRGVEPHLGYWCLPGGVRDEGEQPEETARRETREETGLDVEVVKELGRVIGPITGRPHGVYLCAPTGGRLRPGRPEVTDVRWIPHEELPGLPIPPFIREFIESSELKQLERRASSKCDLK